MIKVDIKKFIRDRIWFGWYYAERNFISGERICGWKRISNSPGGKPYRRSIRIRKSFQAFSVYTH